MFRTILLALAFVAVVAAASPATAQDAPPKPVYLAVGDSLTNGLYATDGRGWVYMVADALPGYTLEVVRAPGVDNAIDFLPAELADHAPQLVTIEVGINNINYTDGGMAGATFLARYVAMLTILKDAGVPRVVACTVPWTAEVPGSIQYDRALQFNAIINFTVPAFGYEVADCWGATVERWDYLSSIDKFHPNDAGHRAIADAALRAILPPMLWVPDLRR
jgi:acyl-CoA thioesterase I